MFYIYDRKNINFNDDFSKIGTLNVILEGKKKSFPNSNLKFNSKEDKKIRININITSEECYNGLNGKIIKECNFNTGHKVYYLYSNEEIKIKRYYEPYYDKDLYYIYFDYCVETCYDPEHNPEKEFENDFLELEFEKNEFNKINLKFHNIERFFARETKEYLHIKKNKENFIEENKSKDLKYLNENYNIRLLETAKYESMYLNNFFVIKNNYEANEEIDYKGSNFLNKVINKCLSKYEKKINKSIRGLEEKIFQIVIIKKERFKSPKEIADITLNVINIFSILCGGKKININSIKIEAENKKTAYMVFNRFIEEEIYGEYTGIFDRNESEIVKKSIPFQAFIDNFENIFKNYFELKENKGWFVDVVNFFINMDEDYFLRYSNTLYTLLYENFYKIFENKKEKFENLKLIFTKLFKEKKYKNKKELQTDFEKELNDSIYKDITDNIINKFENYEIPKTFEIKCKECEEYNIEVFYNYFKNKILLKIEKDIYCGFNIIYYINILDEKNKDKLKSIIKIDFEDNIKNKIYIGNIFRELRNKSAHNGSGKKYIKIILENKNHELTNLTILLKYIIICEFLLELGFSKEIAEEYFKNNAKFIN